MGQRAALDDEARATGEVILGGGAVSRGLAAMSASDAVGSSGLMEAEEAGTLARFATTTLHDRCDERTTGDGPLDGFASGGEAAPISAN